MDIEVVKRHVKDWFAVLAGKFEARGKRSGTVVHGSEMGPLFLCHFQSFGSQALKRGSTDRVFSAEDMKMIKMKIKNIGKYPLQFNML